MEQVQKRRSDKAKAKETEQVEPTASRSPEDEELIHHSDDLLDAIDAILEENAEAFVRDYVQSGGQ